MAERLTDKRLIEIRTWLLCKKSQTDYSIAPEVPLELLDEIDALRSERDDLQRALRQCAAHCAHLTGEDKEDFAELDRTTAVPLLEVGELVSDTIAGLEFEAAQKDCDIARLKAALGHSEQERLVSRAREIADDAE